MRVQIRKSVAGTEYWDTEEKRSIFVPNGQKPNFDVSENPYTLETPEGEETLVAVDHSNGKDKTVTTGMMKKEDGTIEVIDVEITEDQSSEVSDEFEGKTIKQLREYAKKNNITIPAAIKTRGDILNIISNAK
jgi:hypothetical protein